ncbi:MAG: DUF6152 family protein [Alteraurantiacibacter sp.]
MNLLTKFAIAAACLSACGTALTIPVQAHHSFSMFDQTRTDEKLRVTVAEFRFTNPHSFVVVNVQEGSRVTRYVLECSSVNMMSRAGWRHNSVRAGQQVDVTYYPLRNGRPGGMLRTIKLPDGRTLNGW